jgi:hypothetical protein
MNNAQADTATCQHQDHGRDLHARNSGERALGHQLSDAEILSQRTKELSQTEEPGFSPEELQHPTVSS